MKDEIELLEDAAFASPMTFPDRVADVKELAPSTAEFPCPGEVRGTCATADWLGSRERAGLVFLHHDTIAPAKRTSDQWNDLGIALAWVDDWSGAAEAFKEAEDRAQDEDGRRRATHNAEVARRAIT